MKELLNKFFVCFLLSALLCACVDSKYDLSNIDDSGGLSPVLVLPIGTLNTEIINFLKGAGIADELKGTDTDTIYVEYTDVMSLQPTSPIFDYIEGDVITEIPEGLRFGFDGGSASVDLNFFDNLASSGNVLILANPMILCTIKNHIGANVSIDINSLTSENNEGDQRHAIFSNGDTKYSVDVESPQRPHEFRYQNVLFDRTNGQIHNLFAISPSRLSFDISVDLVVPNDGQNHFIVKNKYVDVDYKVKIPLTFDQGTMLSNSDTMELDLSGDGFINNLDGLTLWIDYTNSLRTTIDLDILFLDEHGIEIPDITKQHSFHMDASTASGGSGEYMSRIKPATGSFTLSFDDSKADEAQKVRYAILKSTLKTDNQNNESVNIHPKDYIKLKLSAYSKVNI
jgi:hypothetical protein